jgi:AraC-like DNA-binding protein
MKPFLVNISTEITQSFSARCDISPDINGMWHYHTPLELIYFKKGRGLQFVGDSVKNFKEGDVVLIGNNLPHYWRFDHSFFEDAGQIEVYVIHFEQDFLGNHFFNLPEIVNIKKLLQKAKRGIQVLGKAKKKLATILPQLVEAKGVNRIVLLLQSLTEISISDESQILVSSGFEIYQQDGEINRMQAVYNYTINNYKNQIALKEIAGIAKITPNSFCKFFKLRNKKTYTHFVNEIRVGQACKLLIEDVLSIKEVCYECGFNNFTSFHKFFKDIKGKSPLKYKEEVLSVKQ